jgi:RimJ/RimL family protein N-acetyltransferase
VAPADAHLLWTWANDPGTREMAFSTRPIGWDEHVAWLDRVLAAPDAALAVIELDGQPIGHLRLVGVPEAEVSLVLAPEARGHGLGGAVVLAATTWAARRLPGVRSVLARVRVENVASQRCFEDAGFAALDGVEPLPAPHRRYSRQVHVDG